MSIQGFFFKEEPAGVGCSLCPLSKGLSSSKKESSGEGRRGLLIIVGAPEPPPQLLKSKLRGLGIDFNQDCRASYSVSCLPPNNYVPTEAEIVACRPKMWKEIESFKPKVILLLGEFALESFLGHRWSEGVEGIGRWRGWAIPDREAGAWVVPTYDPSFIEKSSPVLEVIWEKDLKLAVGLLDRPFPMMKNEGECVSVLSDEREVGWRLEELYIKARKGSLLTAFDYETTGLKPYAEGHRIVSASICAEEDLAYSFLFPPAHSSAFKWWRKILECEGISKTAHNMKFEDTWTKVRIGTEVKGWKWCSMQAAHIQDNRPGINGLDFQAYIKFGLLPWGGAVSDFLKSRDKKDGNSFNNIDKAPVRELLKYGGIDALVQHRLATIQMMEMEV